MQQEEMKAIQAENGSHNTTDLPFSNFTTVNSTTTDLPFSDFTTVNSTEINTIAPLFKDTTDPGLTQSSYITIYSVLIIFSIILTTGRSLLFFKICMNASKRLHNLMFSNILQATMRFFDTNPSGRILNRFSKDMGAMDELLPRATIESIQIFLVMSGILVMVFVVSPWMIAVAAVLGILFYWFRVIYLATALDVKRLEGISMQSHFCLFYDL